MDASCLPLLAFLAGAALLAAAVRWWRRALAWADAALLALLTAGFFFQPLAGGATLVPTDLAYEVLPWRQAVPEGVAPRNRLRWDTLVEQLPFHTLDRRRLLALEAPLWSHEMGTGQPLLGNAQAAPFAPLHLLALPLPPLAGLGVSAAWALFLEALFAYVLARALGAGRPGALLAGVATGFSTATILWLCDTPGMTAAWVPGVLLCVVSLAREEKRAFTGLVACGLGMAASGHPETLAHAGAAALVVAGAAAAGLPRQALGRYALRLLAAAALTASLSAPILLPFLEQLPRSERMDLLRADREYIQPAPFQVRSLAPFVDPFRYGSPRDDNWAGPENFATTASGYVGLATLALALAGALVFRGRILAVLAGGMVSLLLALRLPPLFGLWTALPPFSLAANERLRFFWSLAAALAAGLTLTRLAESRPARRMAAALLLAAGVAAALLAPPSPIVLWQQAWWIAALGAAGVAALVLAWPRPLPGALLAGVLGAGVVLDLFLATFRYPAPVPRGLDLSPPPALLYLMRQSRTAPQPFRVIARGYDLLPSLGAVYGIWDPRGNDPMRPAEAYETLRRRLAPRSDSTQILTVSGKNPDRSFLEFLGVRYLLLRHTMPPPRPPWREVFDGPGGWIWENPDALPLFFVPQSFRRVTTAAEVEQEMRVASEFIEEGIALGEPPRSVPQEGTVERIRPRSNGFDLAVSSPTGGMVVSSVSYDPGWRAELDGKPLAVDDVNGGFLGFPIPPGRHRVRLDYRPLGWTVGLALFALGLAAVAVAGAWPQSSVDGNRD